MLDLIRFDPFVVTRPRRDLFNWFFGPSILPRFEVEEGSISPKVDITESDKDYILKAEFPGFSQEEVKVEVDGGCLRLSADHKEEKEEKKEDYHLQERYYGSYCRVFDLPDGVDADKIEASSKDGVLTLVIPKTEASKPKQIEIKVH